MNVLFRINEIKNDSVEVNITIKGEDGEVVPIGDNASTVSGYSAWISKGGSVNLLLGGLVLAQDGSGITDIVGDSPNDN